LDREGQLTDTCKENWKTVSLTSSAMPLCGNSLQGKIMLACSKYCRFTHTQEYSFVRSFTWV